MVGTERASRLQWKISGSILELEEGWAGELCLNSFKSRGVAAWAGWRAESDVIREGRISTAEHT